MPAPTTPILDTFNRADENPLNSSNWGIRLSSGGQIVSNQCLPAGVSFDETAWKTAFSPNQECYFTIPTLPTGGGGISLIYRCTSPTAWDNYYRVDLSLSGASFARITGGSTFNFGPSMVITLTTNDQVWVKVEGSDHTFYQNGTAIGSGRDGTQIGQYIGVLFSNGTGAIDDFGGGGLGSTVMWWKA